MASYRLGSFNLYKFSTNTNKDTGMIARIIEDQNIDILAIQEIFSDGALQRILVELGMHWDGRWASPDSKSVSAAEGYSFIWNKDRIELSQNRSGKVFEPVIHNQYPHKEYGELIRNPFYGRFVAKANRMIEFRLINTHIMFSQNRSINDSEDHDSSDKIFTDVEKRRGEFSILASKILPKLDDKVYDYQWNEVDGICRKPYTILLGDYNLNLKSELTHTPYIDPVILIEDAGSIKSIRTIQTDLTTLKAKTQENPVIDGYRNL